MTAPQPAALPRGGWPVMLTPFAPDHSIDFDAVDEYVRWMLDLGAAGLFANALSSEMYDLTSDERDRLARGVVRAAKGRAPVVASSPVAGSPERQAEAVAEVAATGVDAVVLISSLLAPMDASERSVIAAINTIVDRNPGVRLGVYECPLPFKRLVGADTLRAMLETGSFVFLKDTSHSMRVMCERLEIMEGSRLQLYNAAIASLTASLTAGAAGLSGYVANIYPDLVSWLCEHYEQPEAHQVQRLLTVVEHSVNLRYPTSAKYLLRNSSRLDFETISRWKPESIGDHEGLPLRHLAEFIAHLPLPAGALAVSR